MNIYQSVACWVFNGCMNVMTGARFGRGGSVGPWAGFTTALEANPC